MQQLVGACGLLCDQCGAYQATQAGDPEALRRVAESWRVEYSNPSITPEGVVCDGCMTASERCCFHCAECDMRACAVARGYNNCAYCPDYGCDKVAELFAMVPQAKAVLDEIRAKSA